MSLELSILLSLAVPAVLLAYIGFSLKDKHSSMKLLMVSVSLVFLLGVPFTGWKFAENSEYGEVANYFLAFELAAVVVFIVFVFYAIWLYLVATGKVVSGSEESYSNET